MLSVTHEAASGQYTVTPVAVLDVQPSSGRPAAAAEDFRPPGPRPHPDMPRLGRLPADDPRVLKATDGLSDPRKRPRRGTVPVARRKKLYRQIAAARAIGPDGRQPYVDAEGRINVPAYEHDRRVLAAFDFCLPGWEGKLYPFRTLKNGVWVGDLLAMRRYRAWEQAKRCRDHQGRPLFHDPLTGRVDMAAFYRACTDGSLPRSCIRKPKPVGRPRTRPERQAD
ncbi:hypothetical protein GT347_18515 [Xylophilus rhododendri]|uniref:Uncharacterized protein n=1 Tax=Xylophilus rhododendri TaxID=2697032 RepID=A0A857JAN5_9BURK|nr:hypothetical protein [Xylophilus rhododendri]QHI99798.1 hypothetical protein GT347_18515 [Xylophilus rhododendri]